MTGVPIAEAARIVNVARTTVRGWAESKRFHTHRDGSVSKRGMAELEKLADELKQEEEEENESGDLRRKLMQAQLRERKAIGKLRELELERESGRFVELAIVEQDAEDAAERITGVLRAIPQRTAMALECNCRRAAVVEVKIAEEIERAIAELGESTYAGGKR